MPLWDRDRLQIVEARNFTGTAGALARAKYVAAYMQTDSKAYACRMSGLSANAHGRIIDMLCRNGNMQDSERSGRPTVYSEAVMEVAYDKVAGDTTGKMTGKSLVQLLKHEGLLHPTADVRRFLQHLKAYAAGQGNTLVTNYRKTTFFLSQRDISLRLAHAHNMLQLLEQGDLARTVFVDEVIVEQASHAKCKIGWAPVNQGVG